MSIELEVRSRRISVLSLVSGDRWALALPSSQQEKLEGSCCRLGAQTYSRIMVFPGCQNLPRKLGVNERPKIQRMRLTGVTGTFLI